MADDNSDDKPPERPLIGCSALGPDGTIAEMLYRHDPPRTLFGVARGSVITEQPSVEIDARTIVRPFTTANNLLVHRVVLFPSEAEEYGEAARLVGKVRSFIHRYADVSAQFEEIASYYVLLSWVYDAFNEVPYLRLKGDFGTGKSRCLLTIGSLCYKPMFASGASTVSPLFRIIDTFRGTLVMDEGDFRFSDERAELVKILNNGNAAGFPVLRSEATPTKEFNPKAFVVFGPKIIATRNVFEDRALESRCITEAMTGLPPRPDIPLSLPGNFHSEATALRNQLLMYRFRTLLSFRGKPMPEIAECEARIAQIYAPLVTVIDDAGAKERLSEAARAASRTLRAERGTSVEAQLLGIMYEMWRAREPLTIKAVTERFTELLGSDYARPITPRWIGAQVRNRLSLTPTKSHGTFVLGPENGPRLKALFERYGLGDIGDVGDVPAVDVV